MAIILDGTTGLQSPSATLATPLTLGSGGTTSTTAPAAMATLMGFTTTPTAAGTTILTNTSSYYQVFTGISNQIVQLPVTSTLAQGWTFHICNNSTGTLTVNSSGSDLVITIPAQVTAMVTCVAQLTTTASDWEHGLTDFSSVTGSGAVVLNTNPTIASPTIASPNITTGLTLTGSTGTAGQVLTSAGAGAPVWATAATSYIKTDMTPYDATLSLPSALGTYQQYLAVSLTATTELILLWGSSAAFAAVWDNTTRTFGTPVLVRTATFSSSSDFAAYNLSSTSVLVCSLPNNSTPLQTVVLSVSGTTITVNTPVSTTLASNSGLLQTPDANNGAGRILLVGTSYVLNYFSFSTGQPCFRAITVSGVTPTVGSELTFAAGGNAGGSGNFVFSSSVLIHISSSSTLLYAVPISVSGTTLTKGTQATTTATNANATTCGQLSSNRIAVVYRNTTPYGAIVSVTGTTASISTVSLGLSGAPTTLYMQVFGLQAIVLTSISATTNEANVLTDSSGTAVAGSNITNPFGSSENWAVVGANASEVFVQSQSNPVSLMTIGISGNNPTLNKLFPATGNTGNTGSGPLLATYRPYYFSNFENSGLMRTAGYKTVTMQTSTNFFTTSFNGTSIPATQQAVGFANTGTVIRSAISNSACWMSYANSNASVWQTAYFRRVELA